MSRRRALVALFAVYLALLVWVVLWKLEVPSLSPGGLRVLKLVPFGADDAGTASSPPEVLANLLLFVPFGVGLGLLAPDRRGRGAWWRIAVPAAATSAALEAAQYALAVGVSDVTDVIVNTAGALAGFGLLALARGRIGARAETVVARVFAIGVAVAVLAAAAFFASPIRFRQPDVSCSVPGDPTSCAAIPGGLRPESPRSR